MDDFFKLTLADIRRNNIRLIARPFTKRKARQIGLLSCSVVVVYVRGQQA